MKWPNLAFGTPAGTPGLKVVLLLEVLDNKSLI